MLVGAQLFDRALTLVHDGSEPESAAYALDRKGMTLAFLARPTEGLATLQRALELVAGVNAPTLVASIRIHREPVRTAGRPGTCTPLPR